MPSAIVTQSWSDVGGGIIGGGPPPMPSAIVTQCWKVGKLLGITRVPSANSANREVTINVLRNMVFLLWES